MLEGPRLDLLPLASSAMPTTQSSQNRALGLQKALTERIHVLDGAYGTLLQAQRLDEAHAVQKSVDLLQLSSDTFLDIRSNCVSCHHQNLPGVAIAWARDRGFHVRQESINRMIQRQIQSWEPRVDRAYQLDSPYPGPPRFLGWGMWSFAELGYRPDELTRAVSWYLAAIPQ